MSTIAQIETLREERAAAFDRMKALNSTAVDEKRDLTAEEAQEYDRVEADFDRLTKIIDRDEKLLGIAPKLEKRTALPPEEEREVLEELDRKREERNEAREGEVAKNGGIAGAEYRSAFERYIRNDVDVETRAAMQVGTASEGGYTVPEGWVNQLVESLREFSVMRQLSFIFQTAEAGQIHVPKVATDGTAALTAEEAAYTESEDTFGEVLFDSYKIGTLIKISDELLNDSLFDLSAFIARRAGQAISIAEGAYFVTGTGTAQPNGVVTASALGKTAAAVAAITAAELIDLYHSLLSPYRGRASWLMKDSTAAAIRKLTDSGSAGFTWQPGMQAGQPDILFGRPVYTDPNMPALATGNKTVLFGDFSAYWIREVGGTELKTLNELYAVNGQVGYRVSRRVDGDLVDAAAMKHLIQA